ncbi:neuropeptide FF receptor 2 isoform X1 [Octopus bimaculoides]|uniref:G-protein coupled receptors family 1 profile domain-containing protein n=1 Tax=Octopus bimaculoides TaxID=37653 RepID=A0A0L8I7S0_OCTBM|nr:neuropeptide FF receptor 2 isoform X1 [Octopus bimaculoides]XP_014790437.1 neuropeptide FF receptor 2 isoform X1 [Octopus bimaculoides]XP_014790438.1 neuropeptide FF receptor 2 isoform X1 [Octopus bimaculoides]|eukprot:XP_014790436.1 PREDICTED: neuropeptide FF receptor 2-like [Octopus bimaculoides]
MYEPCNPASENSTAADSGVEWDDNMYFVMVILIIFSISGTIGNALVLYVFSNTKQKLTSTIFILALAGMDFITCLLTIPSTVAIEYVLYYVQNDAVCKMYHFLQTTTVPFSALVMVAIASDRYLCICHPFVRAMTTRRAQILVALLGAVAVTLGIIGSLAYSVYKFKDIDVIIENGTHLMNSTPVTGIFSNYTYETDTYAAYVDGNGASSASLENNNANRTICYTGICDISFLILPRKVFTVYQTIYSSLFLISLVIVAFLYALIYRSVLSRRKQRLKIVTNKCCLFWSDDSQPSAEETEITTVNTDSNDKPIKHGVKAEKDAILKHGTRAKLEKVRIANLKTAAMLFVVTLVFVLAFLPSWLMAHRYIQMNIIVFYMYFSYNIANPVVYAFMNRNFKNQLKEIFINCKK